MKAERVSLKETTRELKAERDQFNEALAAEKERFAQHLEDTKVELTNSNGRQVGNLSNRFVNKEDLRLVNEKLAKIDSVEYEFEQFQAKFSFISNRGDAGINCY